MKTIILILLGFLASCLLSIGFAQEVEKSKAAPIDAAVDGKNWPKTADELLAGSQISFNSGGTSRRIDLKEKVYRIYGIKMWGLCVLGAHPVEVIKTSPVEVQINVPPVLRDDPDEVKRNMCHGRLFTINTENQSFIYSEYHGDPVSGPKTGPYKIQRLEFNN